ncbi:MAG: ABC transporter substrate-binding protein [Candidatus Odinarchaeota archaeon]
MEQQMKNIVLAIIATAIIVGGIVGGISFLLLAPTPGGETDTLEIYHWWTSGGEKAAIEALIKVFTDQNPNTTVKPVPVTGGAGFSMLSVIKTLVLAGEAPDAFQMHAGYEGVPYHSAGYLEQIDSIWTSEGLTSVIPEVVQSMCKYDGHFYAVPVNIHRSNVVWYNKTMLSANGIDPTTLTNWTAFFSACDTLVGAGITKPISMGEAWTAAHAFEQILASRGIDVYEKWINGEITSSTDADLVGALNTFKQFMGYVNTGHSVLQWNDATAKVINGEAAFNIMGDWANGEFFVANKTHGTDYGTMAVPGTENMYGLVIDCFQHPKNVAHPTNSDKWLKVVGSKAGQDAFNPIKGSISARNDTDQTKYGAYQKSAISDFGTVTYMFPSVVHGSGAPEAFKVDLNDIISQFVSSLDVAAAAAAIVAATNAAASDYVVVWSLD